MRRLFKKYNLLIWLGLLLLGGLAISSATLLTMSRDLLQQNVKNSGPLSGGQLSATLQRDLAKAQAMSSRIPEDTYLREWLANDEPDTQALIAHLKSERQADGSVAHFVVAERDQKYIDSFGTVRSINPGDARDAWYRKVRDTRQSYDLYIGSDRAGEQHPMLYLSYRILDSDHQYLGVVGLIVPLNLFAEDGASSQDVTQTVWPLVYVNTAIGLAVALAALTLAWFSIARHQSRMRALASRDSMTGLMNRQSFTHSFQQEVLEMQRLKLPLSFILFDIDYLKKINESHGHATGDRIIMDIAHLSRRSVRGSDLLCRWGGEQFALLLKRCDLEQAYKVAEQLRLNVQNHPFAFDDRTASVTISLGVAELTDNETIDDLFARVDEAVFLAKSEGRNRAEISYYVTT